MEEVWRNLKAFGGTDGDAQAYCTVKRNDGSLMDEH